MRKKILIASIAVLAIASVVLFLSLRSAPNESPLIGHQFAMHFYPVGGDQKTADWMNQHAFSVEFVTDSTYIRRSISEASVFTWRIYGDSISLGANDRYLIASSGNSLFLINDKSKIELLPLR